MATFGELKDRLRGLLELGGYTNAQPAPADGTLINLAYKDFVWRVECNWDEDASLVTVAEQAVYDLPTPQWKIVTDVYYDSNPLDRVSPYVVRREEPNWLMTTSSTPLYYWTEKPQQIRLYPKPSEADVVITLYGVRAPEALVSDAEETIIPDVYDELIAKRAFWIEAEKTARGEERQALLDQVEQYQKFLGELRTEYVGDRLLGVTRRKASPPTEFIQV